MILFSDLRVMTLVRLMELVIIMVLMQDTADVSHVRILIFVLQFTCNILQPNTAIYKEYLISGPLGVQP